MKNDNELNDNFIELHWSIYTLTISLQVFLKIPT